MLLPISAGCLPPSLTPQNQKGSKKEELPKHLRQDPPTLRVLGEGMVALESLLAGEPLVSTVCNFGVIRTLDSDRLTFIRVREGPCCNSSRPRNGSGQRGSGWGGGSSELPAPPEAPARQGPNAQAVGLPRHRLQHCWLLAPHGPGQVGGSRQMGRWHTPPGRPCPAP